LNAPHRPGHLALVGTTASGKSAVALALARELGDVELVSVDSMQVYRGMDIGTAKPSPEEQARVPHHLIDVADPDEDFTVARFQAAAARAIAGIESRGRRALLVGGTGLSRPRSTGAGRTPWPISTPGWVRSTRWPRRACCPATGGGC
jgi:tRNA dimethylallyltransferase